MNEQQLLERIAIALENLNEVATMLWRGHLARSSDPKAKIPLGFGEAPAQQYIFVGNEPGQGLWYFLGEDSQKNYIPHKALTGTIKSLEIVHREYKNKEHAKLDITIEADRTYIVRTGFGTVFCKGLLLALNTLGSDRLTKPLTIAVAPGEETVVFARCYDAVTKKPLIAEWEPDADFSAILLSIQSKLQVWRTWKKEADAIAWAATQLPELSLDVLQAEFDGLAATNGKKAIAWIEKVEQLKEELF